jgi:YteA family regulatory protein
MEQKKLSEYKKRLLDEKKRLSDILDSIKSDGIPENQRDELSELSMVDNHPGDMGTEMFDKQRAYALMDNERRFIMSIDRALDRIENGTYGKCELCGKEISEERLDFMPNVTTCIDCEEKRVDHNYYKYDRPVEEEVLGFPFGRHLTDKEGSFMDVTEYNGYDGEDAWQDVDSFNAIHGRERNYDDDYTIGTVEPIENVSNQQYKNQLP